jgi:outer membrane protein OmpA-like peptidoglycan-associated protein
LPKTTDTPSCGGAFSHEEELPVMAHSVNTWSQGVAALFSIFFLTATTASASGGLRTAGVNSVTELVDEPSYGARAFLRSALNPRWQIELNAGYSRLSGSQYETNAISTESRLLYSTGLGNNWSTGLYSGFGFLGYRLTKSPPRRTPGAKTTGWSPLIPVGIYFSRPLGATLGIEILAGYTYTLSDEINRSALTKGNDAFWSLEIGIVFGDNPSPTTHRTNPQPVAQTTPSHDSSRTQSTEVAKDTSADSDGDGLSDREEKLVYFTNPVMADSDGDGLSDREEIEIYGTQPNHLDSDSGGLRDGDEVRRGADPLDPGDDFVPKQILEEEPEPSAELVYELPVIYFPTGNLTLVAEARENLERTVTYMRMRPQAHIELRGHSDSMGSRGINLQLSRRRAEAVKAYLVEKGIQPVRLRVRAYGESKPVASNATEGGRLKNRRVELVPVR